MTSNFLFKDLLRMFAFYTVFFATAFAVVMGIELARGDFAEPSMSPPWNSYPPLNTSTTSQTVAGTIAAQDFYVKNLNRWISQGPKIVVKEMLGGNGATVYCDPGYQLIGCSGSRSADAGDYCSPETDCAYAGVIPVTNYGTIVFTRIYPTEGFGCKLGTKTGGGAVHAYCMKNAY